MHRASVILLKFIIIDCWKIESHQFFIPSLWLHVMLTTWRSIGHFFFFFLLVDCSHCRHHATRHMHADTIPLLIFWICSVRLWVASICPTNIPIITRETASVMHQLLYLLLFVEQRTHIEAILSEENASFYSHSLFLSRWWRATKQKTERKNIKNETDVVGHRQRQR